MSSFSATKGTRRIFLSFASIEEFEQVFQLEGRNLGLFHQSADPLPVGQRISILASIKGIDDPLFLKGRVMWRRARSGGPGLSLGAFIALEDEERGRFESMLDFLHKERRTAQRRSHVRYPIHLRVTCRTRQDEFHTETVNLSRTGAYLRCSGPVPAEGEQVDMTIFLDSQGAHTARLEAVVRWRERRPSFSGVGVMFLPAQPGEGAIQQMLDRIESSWNWIRS